jgi:hypothetical protein
MSSNSGSRFARTVFSFLELILKQITGPARWRPAGAVKELPPSALVYDSREGQRADEVFRTLAGLGFTPTRVAVGNPAGDVSDICRSISRGAEGCWAAVIIEPNDDRSAGNLGRAFRQFAHLHPEVVAIVVGPLPSRAEILDRYRHVVTADDGGVAAPELAAGMAHASAARVLHYNRLLSTAAVFFLVVAIALGLGLTWVRGVVAQR